jgi:hypothetical protein
MPPWRAIWRRWRQRAARLALIAAVADAYLEQRLAEEQMLLTQSTLADWRVALDITQRLHRAQQRGGIDVAQAAGRWRLPKRTCMPANARCALRATTWSC